MSRTPVNAAARRIITILQYAVITASLCLLIRLLPGDTQNPQTAIYDGRPHPVSLLQEPGRILAYMTHTQCAGCSSILLH